VTHNEERKAIIFVLRSALSVYNHHCMSPAVTSLLIRLALGLLLSSLIGIAARRRGSLSASGVWGAILTGTLVFGFGGWGAGLLLIAFFVSSSLLSHFKERDARKQRAAETFDKGGQRDLWQALANGGAATLLAVLGGLAMLSGDAALAGVLFTGMAGALAAANADTWATELGVLSTSPPRLITHLGKTVAPGTSGGITGAGTLAALAGATFISVLHLIFMGLGLNVSAAQAGAVVLIAVIAGGVAGSLFDSFLGATVQAMYYSEKRQKETEKPVEKDGSLNRPIRGWRWLSNDWVNFIATLFGAGVAMALSLLANSQ
jgi:uncharacterized protein (TIGR00297 family)